MKKILVTAGSTVERIDKVRKITNIFNGKTGTDIALSFAMAGWTVTLLTSNPCIVKARERALDLPEGLSLRVVIYRTFDELAILMEKEVMTQNYDVIIHSSAVSDYRSQGVFTKNKDGSMNKVDDSEKISSSHSELYLRLVPNIKLIDQIRELWGFGGKLIKFKLEVNKTDDELIEIATRSMNVSDADMIVANCLEWSNYFAYIIDREQSPFRVTRDELPKELLRRLE